jgi:cytochrome c-type biogenesis protein CcmH
MKAIQGREITIYRAAKLFLAILFAFTLALTLNHFASAQGPTPTDDEVNRIAKQLYCPVCESTPLDVCPTEACRQWRDLIRTMLADGKSEAEIKQYFVTQYGARVLAEPPNRLVSYLVPAVAILLGAILLARGFQMWLKPSPAVNEGPANTNPDNIPPADPYVARLEEELKKQK